MNKKNVVDVLNEIADILDLRGENPFKSRSYRNAARTLETYSGDFEELVNGGRLADLKGFGESLTRKVTEFVVHGRMAYYDELRREVPDGLLEMLRIQGLGPKKVKAIHDNLRLETVTALEKACQEGRIADLPGFGEKTQENILNGIGFLREHAGRYRLSTAEKAALPLVEELGKVPETERVSVAGSLRRAKETVKDIDILAGSESPEKVMDAFTSSPLVERVLAKGTTKSSVSLPGGINCDLRVVRDDEYPYALMYFTGSREHNTALRARAKSMGMKLNEYGLYAGEKRVPAKDEEAVFRALGLSYIPPELREDLGEIEAAEKDEIPDLIEQEDVRGVIHCHTTYSDGTATLEEMARAAGERGFEYIGIADHSKTATYAGGLSIDSVKRQMEEIDRLNESRGKGKGRAHILKGIESDILTNGDLDYPDEVLALFDFVIASVHSRFGMPEKEMTERIVRAMRNPYTTILGHPTGRLLLTREPYALNLERVIEVAAEEEVMIEINSNPHRLDLDWRWCRKARDAGVMICLCPDAHDVEGIDDVRYGVGVARKGWLTAKDVLNTYKCNEAEAIFRGRRK